MPRGRCPAARSCACRPGHNGYVWCKEHRQQGSQLWRLSGLRPFLVLPVAALVLSACSGAPKAGHMSADQFNRWLLQNGGQTTIGPQSSTGVDNTLSTNLGDWYAVPATEPTGDLQPAGYYAAEVRAECLSIGA